MPKGPFVKVGVQVRGLAAPVVMAADFDCQAHLESQLPNLLRSLREMVEQSGDLTFKRRVCRDLLQRVAPRGSLSYRTLMRLLEGGEAQQDRAG